MKAITTSGRLDMNMDQRGFPKDWLDMEVWVPHFKHILQMLSVNQEWNEHVKKVADIKEAIKKEKSEGRQSRAKALETDLAQEMGKCKVWEMNYKELMDAKKILMSKGVKF